jgi:mediator of RNA polymerase II transcription subunit 10
MSDPRQGLKAAIKDALVKVYELQATVEDFNGDQALLTGRVDALLASFEELHGQRDGAAFNVPLDLVRFVDEGGNPDAFFGSATRAALRDNQAAKGKVVALKSFREAILKEAAEAFPEDAAAYSGLTAAPGCDPTQQQQPQQQQGDASPAAAAEPAASKGPAPLGQR